MGNNLQQARQLIQECRETQNPYLDLGNCGIRDLNDLPELFECTHVETLILSSTWWSYEERKWIDSKNRGIRNTFQSIPDNIAHLKKLKTLITGGGGA